VPRYYLHLVDSIDVTLDPDGMEMRAEACLTQHSPPLAIACVATSGMVSSIFATASTFTRAPKVF
jgi:hypothetical protein